MKKYLSILMLSVSVFLITGCFDKKEDNPKSNESNSNIESNIESNSNVESNEPTSNVTPSNTTTSNVTPSNTTTSNTTPVGNKELVCTMDMTKQTGSVGYKSSVANVNIKFENSNVKLITMDMVFELDSTLAPQIDMLISTMKSTLASQYNNMQGVTVTTNKLSSSKFDILIKMDIDKMNPEDVDKTSFKSATSGDYEELKKTLIAAGYTCK